MFATVPANTTQDTDEAGALRDLDCALMLQVRNNSSEAFDKLVHRHYDRVVRVLTWRIGREHEAEEVAQDVFLRVYTTRSRYVPTAKFSTWLFTIALNAARNAKRGIARRHEVQFDIDTLPAELFISDSPTQIEVLSARETKQYVHRAIERLADRQRRALVLNVFQCMSHDEIASEMQLSRSAVKSLLSRARVNLRQMMHPFGVSR